MQVALDSGCMQLRYAVWVPSQAIEKLTIRPIVFVPGKQQVQISTSCSWVLCHVLSTVHGLQRSVVPIPECPVES